jgi:hypothetical protein
MATLRQTWDKVTNKRIATLDKRIQPLVTHGINILEDKYGMTVRVTCGNRSDQEQERLYAKGRTKPGRRVTWVRAGGSFHNYALAFDVVEIKDKKANWKCDWEVISKVFKQMGFEWGGDWKTPDKPHFQFVGYGDIDQLKKIKYSPS